jgi:hypothetical protein
MLFFNIIPPEITITETSSGGKVTKKLSKNAEPLKKTPKTLKKTDKILKK